MVSRLYRSARAPWLMSGLGRLTLVGRVGVLTGVESLAGMTEAPGRLGVCGRAAGWLNGDCTCEAVGTVCAVDHKSPMAPNMSSAGGSSAGGLSVWGGLSLPIVDTGLAVVVPGLVLHARLGRAVLLAQREDFLRHHIPRVNQHQSENERRLRAKPTPVPYWLEQALSTRSGRSAPFSAGLPRSDVTIGLNALSLINVPSSKTNSEARSRTGSIGDARSH